MPIGQKTFRRGGKGGWDYQVKGPYGAFAMGVSWRDYQLQAFLEDISHELAPQIQRIIAIAVKETLDDIMDYARYLGATTNSAVYEKIASSLVIEREEMGRSLAFSEYRFSIESEDGAVGSRGEELAVLYKASRPRWQYPKWMNEKKKFRGKVVSSRAYRQKTGKDMAPALGFGEYSPGINFGNERMRPFDWEEEVDWHIESKIESRLMSLMREQYGAV